MFGSMNKSVFMFLPLSLSLGVSVLLIASSGFAQQIDLTHTGIIIAAVTVPTGSGNKNIEVIRDGDKPPVGNTDSLRQYDTFDGTAVTTVDWIGYEYSGPQTFSRVVFQEGKHFPNGGWFTNLSVQVRNGGLWNNVSGVVFTPAYPGINNGINYETYTLTFNSISGDAIRIFGAPGGAATFISVGELEVFGPPASLCGNGVLDSGEECDDGNTVSGDGCNADCTLPACGNGTVVYPEQCDDGNRVGGDGCSSICRLENAGALCAGVGSTAGTALDSVLVASGLARPVGIEAPPLDPDRVFILEQGGVVKIVKNGTLLPAPFLDVSGLTTCCGERGLLGLAFHPLYAQNRMFFINYTDAGGATVIARYQTRADNPDVADPASATVLFTIPQPASNHNGGQLAFGPDGYLYAMMGDGGGSANRVNAQDDTSPLGKILRIDVDVATAPFYAAPATNPNPTAPGLLALVWGKGLRNPWRFSFDRATGDLYIADVGENAWKEIDVKPAASAGSLNFGWPIFEGDGHCFQPSPGPNCPPTTGFAMPVFEYGHAQGCSVTGGYVYRGCSMPDNAGRYFYGDFCSAFIRSLRLVAQVAQSFVDHTADVAPGGGLSITQITTFGEDARGELYVADLAGEVFKIVPAPNVCGDGVVSGNEQCDAGGPSATCDADCTFAVCGDGTLNTLAGETCDDGNTVAGDGCSATCQVETACGDANNDGRVTASDGLVVLRSSVGQSQICPDWRCDVDGDGSVTATDAASILRMSVGLTTSKLCPPQPVLAVDLLSSQTLGALQVQIDYSSAAGSFVGLADAVLCSTSAANTTAVFNHDATARTLTASLVSVAGFAGPGPIVQCDFAKTGAVAASDFVLTIVDATDVQGAPVTAVADIALF